MAAWLLGGCWVACASKLEDSSQSIGGLVTCRTALIRIFCISSALGVF